MERKHTRRELSENRAGETKTFLIFQVLTSSWRNRRVAATSMNRESSRSHAVFTIAIESKRKETRGGVANIRTSQLNLVDLAGSERQRDTRAVGVRLKVREA